MAPEIAAFWATLLGLWLADNLVLVPTAADHLRFGRRGHLRYEAATRQQWRGRDLVLLNPLNPFDRLVTTERCLGRLEPAPWRVSLCMLRAGLGAANRLSALGAAYLTALLALALASWVLPFQTVLLVLALTHLASWAAGAALLLRGRAALGLARGRAWGLAFEALVVPGYLVNLGKRVWLRRTLPLPGLGVGLHRLRRMSDGGEREAYAWRLRQRLDDLCFAMGLDVGLADAASPPPRPAAGEGLTTWLQEARTCLTTSVPLAGS